ncbi:MAG: ANTAR domain-containing response regulator [Candidatus Merdivicinus sp.]|jgi:AmiR/NasT family two-component response regulator
MNLQEQGYRVLIVSASDSFNTTLRTLLPEAVYSLVQFVSNIGEAQRTVLENAFDFIIINSPLPDDTGIRFSIDMCGQKGTVVLLFIRNESYDITHEKVGKYGVFTLPKPTSRQMVIQALYWLSSARERLRKLEKKAVSIEEKMEEIRLVNRAKWLLIDKLKMTESDAHRFLEKQAMDRCISRREAAECVIRTYS